jgi:hypothetical protein
MSVQYSRPGPRTTPEEPRPPDEGGRKRPTERAFVIQFDPIDGARKRLRGRVELVASGETIRFRSLKQLVGFMVSQLRRRAAAEPRE